MSAQPAASPLHHFFPSSLRPVTNLIGLFCSGGVLFIVKRNGGAWLEKMASCFLPPPPGGNTATSRKNRLRRHLSTRQYRWLPPR